jgi:hypothetical protein
MGVKVGRLKVTEFETRLVMSQRRKPKKIRGAVCTILSG